MQLASANVIDISTTSLKGLRPPLKWAGGKRWLVPEVRSLFESSQSGRNDQPRLVEPFCGGLAIALGLSPEQALLNDINPHPVYFYRWLRKGLTCDLPMRNDEDDYYRYRNVFNSLVTRGKAHTKKAAELFYYLNRTGYNGLCRFNKKGEFNVPFGRYKNINYVRDFTCYRDPFSDWHFSQGDFALLPLRKTDFIYADPPYDVQFTQYAKEGFVWRDQVRLAKWLSGHRGPVVASNQATDRIVELYRGLGFELRFLDAPRMINCTGDRSPAREILALRNF